MTFLSDHDGGSGWLLLLGPSGGAAFYWAMFRYYRNTDKSNAFERETAVVANPVTGGERDHKVDETIGTRDNRIEGDNVHAYRQRVERVGSV